MNDDQNCIICGEYTHPGLPHLNDFTPDVENSCDEVGPNGASVCTMAEGHVGDHFAGNGDCIVAAWPNTARRPVWVAVGGWQPGCEGDVIFAGACRSSVLDEVLDDLRAERPEVGPVQVRVLQTTIPAAVDVWDDESTIIRQWVAVEGLEKATQVAQFTIS